MERRTFLKALPLGTAGLGLHSGAAAAVQNPTRETARPAPELSEAQWFPDVRGGDRPVGPSFASRSLVLGRSGAAGSIHPSATLAGIEILKRGGSAVDAAIAMNACLGFLEPSECGIGGDLYAMLWDPKVRKVVGIAGSGRSPRSLSLETIRSRANNGIIPPYGAISVSVPGTVDAWWRLHQRYGKLKWPQLFEPAIAFASEGVPVPPVVAYLMKRTISKFSRPDIHVEEFSNARATYAPGGSTPGAGEIFRNPDLARTYRMIAEGGRDAFYEGPIARTIDSYIRRIGGWLSHADLAAHRSEWTDPVKTTYRGVGVHALGANTQGLATLQMLNILENFDLRTAGFQSPLSIHLQAEAKRLAYEDRARFYADPDFAKVPTSWLVSKEYAAQRAKLISPDRVMTQVHPGQAPSQGDTTYLTVADKDGMMVSMIQSIFRGMGSGLVPDGLGFMLHGRGQLFSLQDGHPNIYRPGKRPFQTIIPGFATRDGAPWMSFGVMGGDMQPQGQTQIILNRLDYDLDAQSAGDAPRWHHEGSSQRMGEGDPGVGPKGLLRLETGVPEATVRALAAKGWNLGATDGGFGRYQCVEYRMSGKERVYGAASDMRADGLALAY